ncbi:MAG: response regulator [Alphaproteobacteria bacterium]|nr:response regulator [Alphaproteobacteria bacterium]
MASNQGSGGGGGVTVGLAAAARLGGKATSAVVKQPYPTLDLDPKNMEKVIAFVAEATSEEGNAIAEMLNRAGVLQVTVETDANVLRAKMGEITPDLVIVSASVPGDVFGFVRDIRHSKLGDNPFLMVTTLVDADQAAAVRKAMQAGTDDIIIKPLKEDQLLQRLKRVTVNRQAFVVTSDYLGPDRRAKGRPTSIRRIQVLNTMLEKASGKDIQAEEIKAAVEGSVNDVLHARLDSNSYRLGFVCHIIIDAYKNNNITPDVKDKILVLVDVLRDAAKTAERINEAELGLLCGSLAKQVEEIAERYETPNERDLKTIQKLTRAVMMVVKPHIPAAQMEKETKRLKTTSNTSAVNSIRARRSSVRPTMGRSRLLMKTSWRSCRSRKAKTFSPKAKSRPRPISWPAAVLPFTARSKASACPSLGSARVKCSARWRSLMAQHGGPQRLCLKILPCH